MDKVIKMYCSNEMAALRTLAAEGILENDEYEKVYERIKLIARKRSKEFKTYDEQYEQNYQYALRCREHGASFKERTITFDCIKVLYPRFRRVRR